MMGITRYFACVVMLFLVLASCGYSGSSINDGLIPTTVTLNPNTYFPLTAGIKSLFSNNLTVDVLENGVVQITRKVDSVVYTDTLKFKEEGASILLTEWKTEQSNSNESKTRNYNPPIVFLKDKSSITTSDKYATSLSVDFQIASIIAQEGDNSTEYPNFSDTVATMSVGSSVEKVTYRGEELDAYNLILSYDNANPETLLPDVSSVDGMLITKGYGIVKIFDEDLLITNIMDK